MGSLKRDISSKKHKTDDNIEEANVLLTHRTYVDREPERNGRINMKTNHVEIITQKKDQDACQNFKTKTALLILKCIVWVFDIITIPAYFIIQRPWNVWKTKSTVWAARTEPSDPYSPYVRQEKKKKPWTGIGTMDQLFRLCVKRYGPQKCCGQRELICEADVYYEGKMLKKYELGDYRWMSYNEVDQTVEKLCTSLLQIGVEPKKYVVIFAETRIEWLLILQTCFRLNIPVATLYPNLNEESIVHAINETQVTHIFTSQECLLKIQKVILKLPFVKHIVYMEDKRPVDFTKFPDSVEVMPMSCLKDMEHKNVQAVRPSPPTSDDIAVLMYTSGSTGVPKGVMMSHYNMVENGSNVIQSIDCFVKTDCYIAVLPLAHAFEILSEFLCFSSGVPVGYATPYTLTDKSTGVMPGCKGDVTVLRPTVISAVPLLLDRIRKSVNEVVQQKSPIAQEVFRFAVEYKLFWYKLGFGTPILNKLVFEKVKAMLGGRVRFITAGGAPLAPDTHDFIRVVLDTIIIQGYGLTETGAGATVMSLCDHSSGNVGPPLINCYIKIVDWSEGNYYATDLPNPRGEVVIGGPCVTQGYFKRDDLTIENFKEEDGVRWFYTGDIGEMLPDGCLKVIDRKKDLVKLQNGEYISLGSVETELKTCALVDNICVVGNGLYDHLVALVAPNVEQIRAVAKSIDKSELSVAQLCEDSDVLDVFTKAIRNQGQKSKLQRKENPAKIKLCSEEWTPDSGLVTSALKIKRKVLEQFYQKYIDEMYDLHSSQS